MKARLYWLADSDRLRREVAIQQRADGPEVPSLREADGAGSDCVPGRVADADGRQSRDGELQPGGQHRQQPKDGGASGVGDSTSDGCEVRGDLHGGMSGQRSREGCSTSGLGNPDDPGSQGWNEQGHSADERTPWSSSMAIACTDGKTRRIEPGSFPLAHGVSNRVVRLRAYGNAINPHQGAAFVRAFLMSVK